MTFHISVMDEDHVLGLVRLAAAGPAAIDKVRAFFAPETMDPDDLFRLAQGLRQEDGVRFIAPVAGSDLPDADVLLFRRGKVDDRMIRALPNLKLIQRLGGRSDMIDCGAATERGIWVSCVPRPSLNHTAEHAILLALALAKQLFAADKVVRNPPDNPLVNTGESLTCGSSAYNWAGLPSVSGLYGRTLGIIGLGEVGSLVARLAHAFSMRIIYASAHPLPAGQGDASSRKVFGVELVSMDDLLEQADFVSLHAADRVENHRMINKASFARMRRDAFFINTSRGRLVDEDALYDALRDGAIAGAGLDVHGQEPRRPDDRFCRLPNVILTPHVAGGSRRGILSEIASVLNNCRNVATGQKPVHHVINQASLP